MKRICLISLLAFFFNSVNAQESTDIVIGKIETIDSEILDEEREIWVHVPDRNSQVIYKEQNYPVVYVLDGPSHFYSVVGLIHQMSSVNGNNVCPKMIIVGIANTNRTRDLTPTKGAYGHPYTDSSMVDISGGGDKFMSFIEKELIPHIDSNFPTESYKMLIGHSFGGLTVMNTFVHHPELFNSYVSIDPSMWWSERKLLNEIKSSEFDEKYDNKSLYLGIANTMDDGMDISMAKNDTTFSTDHIRSILDLDAMLKAKSNENFSYEGKYYEKEDHGSLPLIAEYDALHSIFDFYNLDISNDDCTNSEVNLMTKIENHYDRLTVEFGKEILPYEEYINELGYRLIRLEQFDKAEEMFILNTKNYPESFNVFDSLGDYYAEVGNKRKAIKNYKKSLSLNEESYSKPKLLQLQEK